MYILIKFIALKDLSHYTNSIENKCSYDTCGHNMSVTYRLSNFFIFVLKNVILKAKIEIVINITSQPGPTKSY